MSIIVYVFFWVLAGLFGWLNLILIRTTLQNDYPKNYKLTDWVSGLLFALLLGPTTFAWCTYLLVKEAFND